MLKIKCTPEVNYSGFEAKIKLNFIFITTDNLAQGTHSLFGRTLISPRYLTHWHYTKFMQKTNLFHASFAKQFFQLNLQKICIRMNTLGLDMQKNTKVRIASVRIVANFGLQILHPPRFLTPLAISRKFHASPLRGFLCTWYFIGFP